MWEMFERLLMTAEVTGRPERLVQGRKPDGSVVARKAFNEVVPRPWHSTYRTGCDATGLAIHRSAGNAAVVAISELAERTINAQAWYGREPISMNLHISAQVMAPGIELDVWTATVDEIGWYSLASIASSKQCMFVCGSAIRKSEGEAQRHAVEEAVMIFESVLAGKIPRYHQYEAVERFSSLRGPLWERRRTYLFSRLRGGTPQPKSIPLHDVVVWHLVEGDGVSLVRATSSSFTTLVSLRGSTEPDDPFV